MEDWHYNLADGVAVAVNAEGESYWAVGTTVVKLNADGTLGWTYSGFAVTTLSIALENRAGVTYVYSGDFEGNVVCVRDDGSPPTFIWAENVDITYLPPIYALAVDAANNSIYAGASIAAASKGVWQAALSTGIFVKRYASSENIIALAVDMDGFIYCGDTPGNYRKLNSSGPGCIK